MKKIRWILVIQFLLLILLASTRRAYAPPTPTILLEAGVGVLEILAVVFAFLTQLFLVLVLKLKTFKPRKIYLLAAFAVILGLASAIVGLYIGQEKLKFNAHIRNLYRVPNRDDNHLPLWRSGDLATGAYKIKDIILNDEYVLVDIRSKRDYMAVTLRNAINIPLENLPGELPKHRGKKIVLFENGDTQAFQAAQRFRDEGYRISYLSGGLSWLAYRGSGLILSSDGIKSVGMLPRFRQNSEEWEKRFNFEGEDYEDFLTAVTFRIPTGSVLFDTADIQDKMKKGEIFFVDVRPGREYQSENILSIPVSTMDIHEARRAINRVPSDKEVVIACDDLTSGFEALWLGAEMDKKGIRYIGRYTDPALLDNMCMQNVDIFMPRPTLFQNLKLKYELFWKNYFYRFGIFLENKLDWENEWALYIMGILLIHFLLLPMLYFSRLQDIREKKAFREEILERDVVAASLFEKGQILGTFHRKQNFSNILKGLPPLLIYLGILMLLNWVRFRNADPFIGIPASTVIAAVLAGICITISEAGNPLFQNWDMRKRRWYKIPLIPIIIGVAVAVVLAGYSKIFAYFLILNFILLNIEWWVVKLLNFREFFTGKKAKTKDKQPSTAVKESWETAGIIPLSNEAPVGEIGGKAARLGELIREKFPVPQGVVLSKSFLEKHPLDDNDNEGRKALAEAVAGIRCDKFIVRSSACGEDEADHSWAGIFESVLSVSLNEIPHAVQRVSDSYKGPRALEYGGGKPLTGGVIVQEMIESPFMGVVFTVDPGDPVIMSVDVFHNREGKIDIDRQKPLAVKVGRYSRTVLNPDIMESIADKLLLEEIFSLAFRVEEIFHTPQDIEWACREGKVFILQTRSIVYSPVEDPLQKAVACEKYRVLSDCGIEPGKQPEGKTWIDGGMGEALPCPTPASISLFRKAWGPEGALHRAYQALGLPFNDREDPGRVLLTIFSRPYLDRKREEGLLLRRNIFDRARILYGKIRMKFALNSYPGSFDYSFVSPLRDYVAEIKALPPANLADDELFETLRQSVDLFTNVHLTPVFEVNLLLQFLTETLEKKLSKTGMDLWQAYKPGYGTGEIGEEFSGKQTPEEFLDKYGHRALEEFELACPRFRETPGRVEQMLESMKAGREKDKDESGSKKPGKDLLLLGKYQGLKERAKNEIACHIELLRELLLETGQRFQLGEDIFMLEIDEIFQLESTGADWKTREKIARRKAEREIFRKITLPAEINPVDLEIAGLPIKKAVHGEIRGIRVSGGKEVSGKARVIEDMTAMPAVSGDEIIVARNASTALSIIMARSAGMVTGGGGSLSHLAILAREMGVPYIAGCENVEDLKNGEYIILMPDGTVKKGK